MFNLSHLPAKLLNILAMLIQSIHRQPYESLSDYFVQGAFPVDLGKPHQARNDDWVDVCAKPQEDIWVAFPEKSAIDLDQAKEAWANRFNQLELIKLLRNVDQSELTNLINASRAKGTATRTAAAALPPAPPAGASYTATLLWSSARILSTFMSPQEKKFDVDIVAKEIEEAVAALKTCLEDYIDDFHGNVATSALSDRLAINHINVIILRLHAYLTSESKSLRDSLSNSIESSSPLTSPKSPTTPPSPYKR